MLGAAVALTLGLGGPVAAQASGTGSPAAGQGSSAPPEVTQIDARGRIEVQLAFRPSGRPSP